MSNEACRKPVQNFLSYVCAPGHQAAVPHRSQPRRQRPRRVASLVPREPAASPPRGIASDSHHRSDTSPQLAGIEGADLYPEWEAHIEAQRARAAFRLLLDIAASLPHLVLSFKKKGVLKTCRLHERSGGRPKLPYSFIVNKSWVKFYFRFREARSGKDALRRDFDSFEDGNSKGEWTVKLRTEDDVRLLLTHLRGSMRLFDGYLAVDWSAAGEPKQGENSIWLAVRGAGSTVECENPATRQEAIERIETLLKTATAAKHRLLCGFDFPFGYPAGTAQALTGQAGWEAVWSRIAELIEDYRGWSSQQEQPLQGSGEAECKIRRGRTVLGQRFEGRRSRPSEEEAAGRLGSDLALQPPPCRVHGQDGAGGLEALRCRIGRRASANWNRGTGGLAASYGGAGLAVRDAWRGSVPRPGGDLPVADRTRSRTRSEGRTAGQRCGHCPSDARRVG